MFSHIFVLLLSNEIKNGNAIPKRVFPSLCSVLVRQKKSRPHGAAIFLRIPTIGNDLAGALGKKLPLGLEIDHVGKDGNWQNIVKNNKKFACYHQMHGSLDNTNNCK